MTFDLDSFPSEAPSTIVAPPTEIWTTRHSVRCRCGTPLGADHVDAFGYRVETAVAARCACAFLQRALDA